MIFAFLTLSLISYEPANAHPKEQMIRAVEQAFSDNESDFVKDENKNGDLALELMKLKKAKEMPADVASPKLQDIKFKGFRAYAVNEDILVSFYYEWSRVEDEKELKDRFATNWLCHDLAHEKDEHEHEKEKEHNHKGSLHCHAKKAELLSGAK